MMKSFIFTTLLLIGITSRVDGQCARPENLNELRDELIEEIQSSSRNTVQLQITLEKLEAKMDRVYSNMLKNLELLQTQQQQHQVIATTQASTNEGVFDDRFRTLEMSVSSLQRRLDEKLESSMDKVVTVEHKREEQEKIFGDILKKILNTVNTVYEMVHRNKPGSSSPPPGVHRPSQESSQMFLIQDSMENLNREFKEKLDILQSKLTSSIEEVNLYTRIASDKVNYISENMLVNEDVQRIGENNPKIVDTDKVLDVVREEISRCTRAIVNAPAPSKASVSEASSRSLSSPETTTVATEIAFFVGPPRDDCKMTAAIKVPHNCDELGQAGANCDGPYMVYDLDGTRPMKVVCDMTGGRWTLLLRRGNFKGKPLSFDRTWSSYKHGFGNILDEFYIGNEYIHRLTKIPKLLRVELEAFSGEKMILDYANFTLGAESDSYRLTVGKYLGNNMRVGNAFRRHNDKLFLTRDRLSGALNSHQCPTDHKAGHWWHSCYSVLLTGEYATPETANSKNGIRWSTWRAEPLKAVVLKIRDMD